MTYILIIGLVTGFDDTMMLEVSKMCSNTMFISIVQISSLATACIGQPLLTFWNHAEQIWTFALISCSFKDYCLC